MIEVVRFDDVVLDDTGGDDAPRWSFAVEFGEVVGVVAGPSEADGVARMCAGVSVPRTGTVEVLGLVPARLSRYEVLALRRRTGVVLRREGLVSNLTLRDNLMVPLVFGGRLPAGEARRWVEKALSGLDLGAFADRRPGAVPRETRITAAVARAALHGPEVLVLESLLGGLPPARLRRLLAWCRERCGSILLLLPGSSTALEGVVDRWVDPVGPGAVGAASDNQNDGERRDG